MSRPSRLLLALIALSALGVAGCGSDAGSVDAAGDLRVVDATTDLPPNPTQASVRFVVDNRSGVDDDLTKVSSPVAASVAIHRSEIDDREMASMAAVDTLAIPARSKVTFEPGGLHVMLSGITEPLQVGQTFDLRLTFAEAGTRTVTVRVVKPGTATDDDPAPSGEMEHDDAS